MLGTELRDLDGYVRGIDHILGDSGDLVAEYKSIFHPWLRPEFLKSGRILRLLYAYYHITLRPQTGDRLRSIMEMLPGHTVLRPQGRLVDLGRRRHGTDTAQKDSVSLEGIRTPESGPDIMRTSDIVKHHHYAGIRQSAVLFGTDTPALDIQKFPVMNNRIFNKSFQHKGSKNKK